MPLDDADDEDAERWSPTFALEFLRRARAPLGWHANNNNFSVAPGVGCFSLTQMRDLLAADGAEERRQEACDYNMLADPWIKRPVLLFPGLDPIRDWKATPGSTRTFRDALLTDMPGLYLIPSPERGRQDFAVVVLPEPVEISTAMASLDKYGPYEVDHDADGQGQLHLL